MKRVLLAYTVLSTVTLGASGALAQWNPRVMLNVTQCELVNGSIVNIASNAQVGPGVGVERLNASTFRLYFASDDIPTVKSPGQYDLYYVDFDIPSRTCGIAHDVNLICEFSLNTSGYEEQPRVSPDGQYLYYLKSIAGYNHKIWIVEKSTNGIWSNPRLLPSLVNSGHDEHSGSFKDGKLYFCSRNRDGSNTGFDMWTVDHDPATNSASNLEKLLFEFCPGASPPNALAWDESDPWITPDGSRLYFAAYGAPGSAGVDIFYSERVVCGGGKMWAAPALLDANVNGPYNENNPTVTDDMGFLFFSSNSLPAPSSVTKTMYCTNRSGPVPAGQATWGKIKLKFR